MSFHIRKCCRNKIKETRYVNNRHGFGISLLGRNQGTELQNYALKHVQEKKMHISMRIPSIHHIIWSTSDAVVVGATGGSAAENGDRIGQLAVIGEGEKRQTNAHGGSGASVHPQNHPFFSAATLRFRPHRRSSIRVNC